MLTLRKSLGQHFLKDENVARKVVSALIECHFTCLLEIGPGAGALTKYLISIPNIHFKAVEFDEEKINYLLANFPQLNQKLIHQDFLQIEKPFEDKFAVVGNFPYNISTEILFKIIDWKNDIECVVGMFQKEVARRISAKQGNKIYGITSVLTQAFFDVEYLFEVNENSFAPPPKVKSAVIRLKPREKLLPMKTEEDFFRLVKTAFNQRRKILRNAVHDLFDPEVLAREIFNKRAEQLSVEDFSALSFQMRP